MFERLTTNLRSAVLIANQETHSMGGNIIGDAELLLGLIKETRGISYHALRDLGIDFQKLESDLRQQPRPLDDGTAPAKLPQTPEFKSAFQSAIVIARNMEHAHMGTEHILLGLLRHPDFASARILAKHAVSFDLVSQTVTKISDAPKAIPESDGTA